MHLLNSYTFSILSIFTSALTITLLSVASRAEPIRLQFNPFKSSPSRQLQLSSGNSRSSSRQSLLSSTGLGQHPITPATELSLSIIQASLPTTPVDAGFIVNITVRYPATPCGDEAKKEVLRRQIQTFVSLKISPPSFQWRTSYEAFSEIAIFFKDDSGAENTYGRFALSRHSFLADVRIKAIDVHCELKSSSKKKSPRPSLTKEASILFRFPPRARGSQFPAAAGKFSYC